MVEKRIFSRLFEQTLLKDPWSSTEFLGGLPYTQEPSSQRKQLTTPTHDLAAIQQKENPSVSDPSAPDLGAPVTHKHSSEIVGSVPCHCNKVYHPAK